MKRLNLSRKAAWVEIDAELRVLLRPLRRAEYMRIVDQVYARRGEAESDPQRAAIQATLSGRDLAAALALAVVEDWSVVDAETGEPLPVTEPVVDALFDDFDLAADFVRRVASDFSKDAALDAEKNGSALSPNGSTAGATDTAKPASDPVRSVPLA
jgi:hypothetical protein